MRFINITKILIISLLIISLILIALISINDNRYLIKADNALNTFNISSIFNNQTEIKNSLSITNNVTPIQVNNSFIDKRAYILDLYFLENNSPLYGTGKIFSEYCDLYGSPKDCIIVAAIAKHETNLCKYQHSAEMFNCWGFGGGAGDRITFNSFDESIERVTRVLSEQYGYRYMVDPRLMETTFCGPQEECIGWGNRVLSIMNDINNFSIAMGNGSLFDLR